MINILSFDCATKTLGVIYAEVDLDYIKHLKTIKTIDDLQTFNQMMINLKIAEVKDIIGNRKVKEVDIVETINLLITYLDSLQINITQSLYLLLENQWAVNSGSNHISSAILAYYTSKGLAMTNIKVIPTGNKTKYAFCNNLTMEQIKIDYACGMNTKYARKKRNKLFTIKNMEYCCAIFKQEQILRKTPANLQEHLADAFMQMWNGFIIYHLNG